MLQTLKEFIDIETIKVLIKLLTPGFIIGCINLFSTEFFKIICEDIFYGKKLKSKTSFMISIVNIFIMSVLILILYIDGEIFKFSFYFIINFILTFIFGLIISTVLYKYAGKFFFNLLKTLENFSNDRKIDSEIEIQEDLKKLYILKKENEELIKTEELVKLKEQIK